MGAFVFELALALALAEQAADDTAEVELLALVFALILILEFRLELVFALSEGTNGFAGQSAAERAAEGGPHHGGGDLRHPPEQRGVLLYELGNPAEELLGFILELALAEQPADDTAEVEALILAFQLILELTLAEQPADDAAEVEVLTLILAFQLILEFRLVLELGFQFGLA